MQQPLFQFRRASGVQRGRLSMRSGQMGFQSWNALERKAQRREIARGGGARRQPGEDPLRVRPALEDAAQMPTRFLVFNKKFDLAQAFPDCRDVFERCDQPAPDQPAPHGALGLVDHVQQGFAGFGGIPFFLQVQMRQRGCVHEEIIVQRIGTQGSQRIGLAALGDVQIADQRPRGG